MGRLNLVLLCAVATVAILLVTSAHTARRLNMAVVAAEHQAMLLDAEYAKLQTEVGKLGMPERVATIATGTLKMRQPGRRIHDVSSATAAPVINLPNGAAKR